MSTFRRLMFLALALGSLFAAHPARADEDSDPPCDSVSDATSKGSVCDWECTSYDSNGACVYTYVCH